MLSKIIINGGLVGFVITLLISLAALYVMNNMTGWWSCEGCEFPFSLIIMIIGVSLAGGLVGLVIDRFKSK